MDELNCITEHRKGQHLSSEERHLIEVRFNKDKCSIYSIAKELNRPYNTIKNETEKGTVYRYNGKVKRYKADTGYEVYLEHRQKSRRKYRVLEVSQFLDYVIMHFRNDGWSFDVSAGRALENGTFTRDETVCQKNSGLSHAGRIVRRSTRPDLCCLTTAESNWLFLSSLRSSLKSQFDSIMKSLQTIATCYCNLHLSSFVSAGNIVTVVEYLPVL